MISTEMAFFSFSVVTHVTAKTTISIRPLSNQNDGHDFDSDSRIEIVFTFFSPHFDFNVS
jgi:hypothetical protein